MYHMYHEFIFRPLYNILVGIMDVVPGVDLGIAVIIFTVVIRFILFPLSKSSLLTQVRMKEIEPEANAIKQQYSADKQVQAAKIMELYKLRGVKPFSGILLVFLQLPILLALISVFYKIIPTVHPEYLYSFIHLPNISSTFLGLDITHKSLILSLATGIIQFLQLHFSLASRQQKTAAVTNSGKKEDMAASIANSMNTQMKFMLPILAFASTYWIIPVKFPQAASIIAIYWSASALFTLGQEIYIRKKYLKSKTA